MTKNINRLALYRILVPVFLLALAFPMVASANSLTTLFAGNNFGNLGNAVYFDVTVGPQPITVTSYDTNTSVTVPFGWEVYLTAAGTSGEGQEGNIGPWNLVATGSGVGAGLDNPSPVTLNNTFNLSANTLYGMALVMGPEAQHDYTNGDGTAVWGSGANQAYSNADLSLSLGSATNVPFTPPPFLPRVWNGTINYNVVPEPASAILLVVGGLALSLLRRR